ncbi:hypothetical protein SAMN06269185_1087 [Natronoarchaeum philippinense]|uniref:DUF7344 domain-containing protein n=1 Tax=Natronoarchaeum philippinense TaxID=558529 RepID=A0A285N9U2_NATPI|nr:hypothetical protein [Natronoarchaeum philippinense]SNZ06209.1 hypothetical protein SAMN06269185_1087 [Natronoarchaeum philippinense]
MANDHITLALEDAPGTLDLEGLPLPEEVAESLLELASNSRRRHAMRALTELESGVTPRSELARRVATLETSATPSDRLVRRVEIALHHTHLPALDEAGVVEYDPKTELLTFDPTPDAEHEIRAVVEWVDRWQSPPAGVPDA